MPKVDRKQVKYEGTAAQVVQGDGTLGTRANFATKSILVANDNDTVFDAGEETVAPRIMLVNGVAYTQEHSYFTVSTTTFANDTWTWSDKLFQMQSGFELFLQFNAAG